MPKRRAVKDDNEPARLAMAGAAAGPNGGRRLNNTDRAVQVVE